MAFIFLKRQKNQFKIFRRCFLSWRYCSRRNCVYVHTWKENDVSCCDCLQYRAYLLVRIFLLKTKNRQLLFGGDGTCCFVKNTRRDYENESPSASEVFSPPITIRHTRTCAKKGKNYFVYDVIVSTPHWLIQFTKISFPFSFNTISVYSN